MRYCPECRSEYLPDMNRCADCDVPLVDHLPPAEPDSSSNAYRPLYSTLSVVEAHTLLALLNGQGIEAILENEHSAMLAVGLPTGAIPLLLSVPGKDLEPAREILREVMQKRTEINPSQPDGPSSQE